jgi:hypothetical protein
MRHCVKCGKKLNDGNIEEQWGICIDCAKKDELTEEQKNKLKRQGFLRGR